MHGTVITFVGMPGAGKSTCVDYLIEKGLPHVYFGGVIVDETIRRYGKTDEEHEGIVRMDLREKEGNGAIANRIMPQIDTLFENGAQYVIADGLYSWTEYKIFKEKYAERAIIIAIAAPRKLRHERLANRPLRPLSDEDVTAREYSEIEKIEKGGPIANADYTIVNNGDVDTLLNALQNILADANVTIS